MLEKYKLWLELSQGNVNKPNLQNYYICLMSVLILHCHDKKMSSVSYLTIFEWKQVVSGSVLDSVWSLYLRSSEDIQWIRYFFRLKQHARVFLPYIWLWAELWFYKYINIITTPACCGWIASCFFRCQSFRAYLSRDECK